jgi:hypothetical protein
MLYDIINLILIVVLGKQVYSYMDKSAPQMEHMDMSLFDTNGNYNPSTTSSGLKSKLEKLEQTLLGNIYYKKNKYLKERDEKAVFDVLSPPEQRVEERQYNYNSINTGIRTRGEPDDYQLIGLLYNSTINKNYQLYGRRIYPGSYEWEYYIRGRDAGGLDFKFPLHYKQEFMDDQEILLPIDNNTYKIKIYNFDQPRYNPYEYS